MVKPVPSAPISNLRRTVVLLLTLVCLGLMVPNLAAVTTIPGLPGLDCSGISGTVTDTDDEPVEGVTVTAYARGSSSLIGSPVTSTQSGEDGTYSLQLAPGTYVLVATSTQHVPETLIPPTVEKCDEPVEGQDFQMNEVLEDGVPLPPVPGLEEGNLHVTVLEELADNTRPSAGVSVTVRQLNCDSPLSSSEETDENGQASFDLEEGEWCVEASADNMEGDSTTVTVGADEIETVTFEISKTDPKTVRGRVEDFNAGDRNIEGVEVTMIHEFYCPGGEAPEGVGYTCSVTSDNDQGARNYNFGTSASERLPWATGSDSYRMCFEHEFYNSKCFEDVSVTPASDTSTAFTNNVMLSRAASSVSGDIIGQSNVKILFEGHYTGLTNTTTTNSEGEFVRSLISDAYRVTFLDGDEPIGYLCLTLRGEDRQLGPFEVDGELVEGKVFDADHTDEVGIGDALMKFTTDRKGSAFGNGAQEGGSDECYIRTDSNGDYAIGLHNATYTVDIVRGDWQPGQENFTVPGGKPVGGLARETGTIRGEVTDSFDGSVVQDVLVTCTNVHTLEIDNSTRTDEEGQFEFVVPFDVAPDEESAWECTAEHDDFFSQVQDTGLNVGPGSTRTVDFDLDRHIWHITGTVTDLASGDPLEGARVCGQNLMELDPDPDALLDLHCDETGPDGDYQLSFEIQFIENREDPVVMNPVLVLATHPGYTAQADLARIGWSNAVTNVDFQLVPEDAADQFAVCIVNNLGEPDSCLGGSPDPEELIPAAPDPTNPNEVFGAAGVNEDLNCGEAPNWDGWLGNTLADPLCESG